MFGLDRSSMQSRRPGAPDVEQLVDSEAPRLDETNNVGARLLKQMGWKEGEGLGKTGSGITAPIQVEQRPQGAGLGSVEPVAAGGNRRTALRLQVCSSVLHYCLSSTYSCLIGAKAI